MHDLDGSLPRPRFHLTPERHWMNDPNGLVFHRGRWHAYFQYNPDGPDWGNMSWGHASSADLRSWEEHPVALRYTDEEQVFSGSVVADPTGEDLLTAYYTSAFADGRQAQSRAVSRDGGDTWERDADNPVLDRGTSAFRDPKVIRYPDGHGGFRWIMLTVEADDRQVLFFSSNDLRSWKHVSTFGPMGTDGVVWECPDLIALNVDGRPEDVRWVLVLSTNPVGPDADPDGSSMSYLVGHFDGTSFTPDDEQLRRVDHGRDYYAGVTFDSAPNGEAVMLGWMSNWRYAAAVPSSPWRGAMSLPRTLALCEVDGTVSLVQAPPAFITELLATATPSTVITPGSGLSAPLTTSSIHSIVELRWEPASTGRLRIHLQGAADASVEVLHDPTSQQLLITRSGIAVDAVHPDFASTSAARLPADRPARLLLSLDGPLLEVFVGDGEATVSNLVLLGEGPVAMTVETDVRGPISVSVVDVTSPVDANPSSRAAPTSALV